MSKDWFSLSSQEVNARLEWWRRIEALGDPERSNEDVFRELEEILHAPRFRCLQDQTARLLLRTKADVEAAQRTAVRQRKAREKKARQRQQPSSGIQTRSKRRKEEESKEKGSTKEE